MIKKYILIILATIYFFIVNSQYYWVEIIGEWFLLVGLFLFIVLIILGLSILFQISIIINERDQILKRIITICIVSIVIGTTIYKPMGLIDFRNYEKRDLLIAEREGVANCTTVLKLKEENEYLIRDVCFGITKITGTYSKSNDTIYFSKFYKGSNDLLFKYGVFEKLDTNISNNLGNINLYRNNINQCQLVLSISKNELINISTK